MDNSKNANSNAMNISKEIVFSALIGVSVIIAGLAFYFSGLRGADLLQTNGLDGAIMLFASIPAIIFFISFPIAFGIVSFLVLKLEKNEVYKISFPGIFLGLIIVLFFNGINFEGILFSIFYLASFAVLIETAYFKKDELKKWVNFRTGFEAAKKAFFVIAIGLFLTTAFDGLAHQEEYAEKLGEKIIELSTGEAGLDEEAIEINADLLLENQQSAIQAITSLSQYQVLKEKNDPDVRIFVSTMEIVEGEIFSEETREKAIAQIREAQKKNMQRLTFDYLREQSPLLDATAKYYWLLNAFSIAFLFLFYTNILGANLSGLFTALLERVLGKGNKVY
ncbi:MAG TPA: hypothetical protein VFF13_00810 [archaeon]|nr:hypothetical protein [archaeon]